MTEDKASSSHVVVPIPTSLEEGEASNVVLKHSLMLLWIDDDALMHSLSSSCSRGVGASRDEERQASAATLGIFSWQVGCWVYRDMNTIQHFTLKWKLLLLQVWPTPPYCRVHLLLTALNSTSWSYTFVYLRCFYKSKPVIFPLPWTLTLLISPFSYDTWIPASEIEAAVEDPPSPEKPRKVFLVFHFLSCSVGKRFACYVLSLYLSFVNS